MARFITIDCSGEIETHIPGAAAGYATLCGMDGNDPQPSVKQSVVKSSAAQVTCGVCKSIWRVCGKYKSGDFKC